MHQNHEATNPLLHVEMKVIVTCTYNKNPLCKICCFTSIGYSKHPLKPSISTRLDYHCDNDQSQAAAKPQPPHKIHV